MDVYARRRYAAYLHRHERISSPVFSAFASAVETCLEMVQRAAGLPHGKEGFALSKSLQSMSELLFNDMQPLAEAGIWPRAQAASLLRTAAATALQLPCTNPRVHTAALFKDLADGLGKLAADVEASPTWPLKEWPFDTHAAALPQPGAAGQLPGVVVGVAAAPLLAQPTQPALNPWQGGPAFFIHPNGAAAPPPQQPQQQLPIPPAAAAAAPQPQLMPPPQLAQPPPPPPPND